MTFLMSTQAVAFGLTADQMQRNILKRTNALVAYAPSSKSRAMFRESFFDHRRKSPLPEENVRRSPASLSEEEAFFSFKNNPDWIKASGNVRTGQISAMDVEIIIQQAEQMNPEAVELLGWMYATGTGVSKDLKKAYFCYRQAANLGVPKALENVHILQRHLDAKRIDNYKSL